MFKVSRFAVAAMLFAGAGIALAQPPGPGGGFEKKRDFEKKKDGERKDFERKDGPRPPAEALERELQQLRARISEVEDQLKKSREGGGDAKRPEPRRDDQPQPRDARPGPGGPGGFNPMGRGPMGGGPGGFGPMGRGGFPGGPMGQGSFGGGPGLVGPGLNLPLEQMSAEQIKQLIGRLQQALEAKSRGGDQPKKPEGGKGGEDVMKRLERIQKELEEIRRSLGK
jgi:hypothetical protein